MAAQCHLIDAHNEAADEGSEDPRILDAVLGIALSANSAADTVSRSRKPS